jgi:5,10-methylenetetrahydromethanopterin reductase
VDSLDIPQLIVVAMDDKDPDQARYTAHYMVTMYLGQQPHIGQASGIDPEHIQAITDAVGSWPPKPDGISQAMRLVPNEVVESLTVAGSADECRAKVKRWETRDNIYPVIMPMTHNYEEIAETFAPEE